MESVKETAYKEENQLFTIIATGGFPRNSDFMYSSAHDVSVPVVCSLMDLNWNDVQQRRGRKKSAETLAVLLLAVFWW